MSAIYVWIAMVLGCGLRAEKIVVRTFGIFTANKIRKSRTAGYGPCPSEGVPLGVVPCHPCFVRVLPFFFFVLPYVLTYRACGPSCPLLWQAVVFGLGNASLHPFSFRTFIICQCCVFTLIVFVVVNFYSRNLWNNGCVVWLWSGQCF